MWEPSERTVLTGLCALILLHGIVTGNPGALAIGAVLVATRGHRAIVARSARRRLALHPGSAIADVALQESIDRHLDDADPFGKAWRDMAVESTRLRACRDLVADSLADDFDRAADLLFHARAQGPVVIPPRTYARRP